MEEHMDFPYATNEEIEQLARECGLAPESVRTMLLLMGSYSRLMTSSRS
jgi:hypothetical protein